MESFLFSHDAVLQQTDLHVRGKSPHVVGRLVIGADRLAAQDLGHRVNVFQQITQTESHVSVTADYGTV